MVNPRVIGNSNSPQLLDLGRAAGFGFIFAGALASSTAHASEYQHGTHAVAVHESQFKGVIFPAAAGRAQAIVDPIQVVPQQQYVDPPSFIMRAAPTPLVKRSVSQFFAPQQSYVDPPSEIQQSTQASGFGLQAEYQFGTHELAVRESQFKGAIWKPLTAIVRPSQRQIFTVPQIDLTPASSFFKAAQNVVAQSITGSEYQFGTHELAVRESQFKGVIWGPATQSQGNLIWEVQGEAQDDPTQIQPQVYRSAYAGTTIPPAFINPPVRGTPQADTSQLAARIFAPLSAGKTPTKIQTVWASQEAAYAQVQPIAWVKGAALPAPTALPYRPVVAAPQTDPTQLAASVFKPLITGKTPARVVSVSAAPQADPTQPQGQVFQPFKTPPAINPFPYVRGAPQADPTQLAGVMFKPMSAGQRPARISTLTGAPQPDPAQIQPQLFRSLYLPPVAVPIDYIQGAPQADPTQTPAQIFRLGAPPARRMLLQLTASPQIDLTPPTTFVTPPARTQRGIVPAWIAAAPQDDPTQLQGAITVPPVLQAAVLPPSTAPYSPLFLEGRAASPNPLVDIVAGSNELSAGPGGTAMGRFGWCDFDTQVVYNARTKVSQRIGFILRLDGTWLRVTYDDVTFETGAPVLREGLPLTVMARGDFWARFPYGAYPGQAVYANIFDGTAYAGHPPAFMIGYELTNWVVSTVAQPGELAVITTWTEAYT